jgi:cobalt-zinc-cadmium efflux system outer membrane protein
MVRLLARFAFPLAAAAVLTYPTTAFAQAPAPATTGPTAGPQQAPLGLDEVLALLDDRNPVIGGAKQEFAAAKGEALAADGAFDPKWKTKGEWDAVGYYRNVVVDTSIEQPTRFRGVTVFGGYRIGQGKFPLYDYKYFTNTYGEARAGIRVPLLRDSSIDKYRATVAKAQQGVTVAETTVASNRIEVVQKATEKYWDWVVAGRKLALARDLLSRAQERDRAIGARVAQGDVAAIDRTDNRRAILAREAQVISAERTLGKARLELSLFVRNEAGEPLLVDDGRLPSVFPEPIALGTAEVERAVADARAKRPDRARYEALKKQYEIEEDFYDNQRLAAVDVQLSGARQFGTGYPEKQLTMVEAGVVVELPLRTRSQDGRRAVAAAKRSQYEANLRLVGDKIGVEVRDAALAAEAARKRVDLARQETEAARTLEAAERRRFSLGDGTILFVNLREQATFDAAVKEVETLAEHHKARAAFRAACGN